MAQWLDMIEVNLVEPSREAEFLHWYEKIHLPYIGASPDYRGAKLCRMKEHRNGRGQFLLMYEMEADRFDQIVALSRKKFPESQGSYRDLFSVIWDDIFWRLVFGGAAKDQARRRGNRWVNLVENNLIDPSREKNFVDWYKKFHLPDILRSPYFLGGKLYIMEGWRDGEGRGRILTLYDIETDDMDKTISERREDRKREKEQGRYDSVKYSDSVDLYIYFSAWRDVLWRVLIDRSFKS